MITWMTDGVFIWGCRDGYGLLSDDVYTDLVAQAVTYWHIGIEIQPDWVEISAEEARADFEDWAREMEMEMPTEYQLKQWGL